MAQSRQAGPECKLPKLNFGGQAAELWCEGGEAAFVARMADESVAFAKQVYRFSTLVSKGGNVAPLMARLQRLGALQVQALDMAQGRRKVASSPTFLDAAEQAARRTERWPRS